ncbi:MAG: T9SS type A sorting domain-containing protein [Phycisphaerae bacterium]|nr:T9SS type A sorting domain-containing protein [Phycisphaerae bacterium]
MPPELSLVQIDQNYPNPFNPTTTIHFELQESATVRIQVLDLAGRKIRDLRSGELLDAGQHSLSWDGRDNAGRPMPSGVYLCRFEVGSHAETRKMTLVR